MGSGGWAYGLLSTIKDPTQWIISNDEIVVIKDKFPKAAFHFLIIPRQSIPSIFNLTSDHLPLLHEMNVMALNIIEVNGRAIDEFKIGFHADPSMQQLHLHVISTDFNSECVKTKKHWNSFNTDFFIPFQKLADRLSSAAGRVSQLSESEKKKLLASPLKCNKCDFKPKNMPDLKHHLTTHIKVSNS